jgi:hypothetical protein
MHNKVKQPDHRLCTLLQQIHECTITVIIVDHKEKVSNKSHKNVKLEVHIKSPFIQNMAILRM